MKNRRNGEIDLMRFLFSLAIVFQHFHSSFQIGFFTKADVAVLFFFMVSGFLMAGHVDRMADRPQTWDGIADATWKFVRRKVGTFFKYYLCVIGLDLLVRNMLIKSIGLATAIKQVLRAIPTVTLTFMGLNYNNVSLYVGNTWYLSAMILAIMILYPLLLRQFSFLSKVGFPLMAVLLMGYLHNTYAETLVWGHWNGLVYPALIWALAYITLGASLYQAAQAVKGGMERLPSNRRKPVMAVLTGIKCGCWLVVFVHMYGAFGKENFVIHGALLCALALVMSFAGAGYGIPDCKLTRFLGKVSLPIYIFHGFIRWSLMDWLKNTAVSVPMGVAMALGSIVVSIALMYLTDWITACIKKCWQGKQKVNA